MPIGRAKVIQLMRGAFKTGQSASSFIQDMKVEGLSYRRTVMLADWRSINELEVKKGRFRFVRKDRLPSVQAIAQVEWDVSREFMYKVQVRSQVAPGEPIEERFVNIMQDRPLTPREVEALAWEMIQKQSPKQIEQVVGTTAWDVIQRVSE